jgi:hypothetical protein
MARGDNCPAPFFFHYTYFVRVNDCTVLICLIFSLKSFNTEIGSMRVKVLIISLLLGCDELTVR